MSTGSDCIIEAGTVIAGVDDDGAVRLRHDVGIRVHQGMIAQIGPMPAVAYGNDHLPRFGGRGMIAMPGLVNAHHHFGLTPLMMGVPFAPLELWLPRFRAMRSVGTRLDTLYSAVEMLESGTTTVHHIDSGLSGTPDTWMTKATETLDAYGEVGMRAGFCFMIRDRNILAYEDDAGVIDALPEAVRPWIAAKLAAAAIPIPDLMDFFRALRARVLAERPDHVRVNLAPANLHWVSDEGLQTIFETARAHGASVHMHLIETERQAVFAERRFGRSAVAHLDALGCLGPELTIGHGNWVSRGDLDRLAACGCTVCHNASSGLRLGSGIAPVNEMRRRGIRVALGIDQSNLADDRDMTLEMKLVWALHRETGLWSDRPDAGSVLRMATEHGAHTVGFGGFAGRLEPGWQADVVLMDASAIARPWISPRTPVAEAVLHRGGRHAIRQVLVGGHLVVDDGRVTGIDRDALMAEIAARLERPPSPAESEAEAMVDLMMPALEAFHRARTGEGDVRSYRYNRMADRSDEGPFRSR